MLIIDLKRLLCYTFKKAIKPKYRYLGLFSFIAGLKSFLTAAAVIVFKP